MNWPLLASLVLLALALSGCGDASGTGGGPGLQVVDTGPPISVDGPRYVVQKNGQDMADGHGGLLEYHDPIVAGVILERLAMGDPTGLYTVVLRGGRWGVDYTIDNSDPGLLQAADVTVQQQHSSGLAIEAPLQAGPAVFRIATRGEMGTAAIEWYLDGAMVAEGNAVTIELTPGEHLLSVLVWTDSGNQSIELPLYIEPSLARVELEWSIPQARENGEALPVSELCCYQVQYVIGNAFAIINVPGGTTDRLSLALKPGYYRFSVLAIDTQGLRSAPSDTVEADLS